MHNYINNRFRPSIELLEHRNLLSAGFMPEQVVTISEMAAQKTAMSAALNQPLFAPLPTVVNNFQAPMPSASASTNANLSKAAPDRSFPNEIRPTWPLQDSPSVPIPPEIVPHELLPKTPPTYAEHPIVIDWVSAAGQTLAASKPVVIGEPGSHFHIGYLLLLSENNEMALMNDSNSPQ